jgi:hypothetical protein
MDKNNKIIMGPTLGHGLALDSSHSHVPNFGPCHGDYIEMTFCLGYESHKFVGHNFFIWALIEEFPITKL